LLVGPENGVLHPIRELLKTRDVTLLELAAGSVAYAEHMEELVLYAVALGSENSALLDFAASHHLGSGDGFDEAVDLAGRAVAAGSRNPISLALSLPLASDAEAALRVGGIVDSEG